MPRGKTKPYDDDRLVALLADGTCTYAEIGRLVGLSPQHVARIAAGRRRRDLLPKIHAATSATLEQSRRLAAKYARALVARHIAAGLTEEGEPARLCREFLLTRLVLTRNR